MCFDSSKNNLWYLKVHILYSKFQKACLVFNWTCKIIHRFESLLDRGCNFPLGFLHAESTDLLAPRVTSPGTSSVCTSINTSPNFPNTLGRIPLSVHIIRQEDVCKYISTLSSPPSVLSTMTPSCWNPHVVLLQRHISSIFYKGRCKGDRPTLTHF